MTAGIQEDCECRSRQKNISEATVGPSSGCHCLRPAAVATRRACRRNVVHFANLTQGTSTPRNRTNSYVRLNRHLHEVSSIHCSCLVLPKLLFSHRRLGGRSAPRTGGTM